MSREIPLVGRKGVVRGWAIVDDEDADALLAVRWFLNDNGYAVRRVVRDGRREPIKMHRVVMGLSRGDGLQVDHINRDRLDNRKGNLRVVDRARQQQNMTPRRGGTSRHRGVSWDASRGQWAARATVGGVLVLCDRFDDEDAAARAVEAARAAHMPFSSDARRTVAGSSLTG